MSGFHCSLVQTKADHRAQINYYQSLRPLLLEMVTVFIAGWYRLTAIYSYARPIFVKICTVTLPPMRLLCFGFARCQDLEYVRYVLVPITIIGLADLSYGHFLS